MNIEFNCLQCGNTVEVDAALRGQVVKCPRCEKGIVVPRSGYRLVVKKGNSNESDGVLHEDLEAECPRCHATYEVTRQEIGTTVVCIKCNKNFTVTIKQPSPEEALAQQIKAWELENVRAEEKWNADVVLWEKRMAELKTRYAEELAAYDRCKLNYVEDLQEGGLLCKCEDDFEFSLKRGEVVYRRVFNVSLEESRGIRRTESHRSSQRSVDWSDDYNGRRRRLGDSYGYDGKSESKTDYQFQPLDTGNIYVTNQRFLFIGQQQQRNLTFDKILSFDYDWIQEGGSIKVRAENRQRAMRFTGGNFYEFALVMKVIREPDFRDFLLKGPREDVKNWLDNHSAFPNWMAPRAPQQPKYPAKPQKPIPRPKPTQAPPPPGIDWGGVLGTLFSGVMGKLEMLGVCVHGFLSGLNGNYNYELPSVGSQRALGCFIAMLLVAVVALLMKWFL